MIIYIDADACPVTKGTIAIAEKHNLPVRIVKSYAHYSQKEIKAHVEVIYVDSESEAVDYKIMAMIKNYDLLITQDYGLASLALQKKALVIHPRGFQYAKETIDIMLASRYQNAQIRKSGGRTKGPAPFTDQDRKNFVNRLTSILT